MMVPTALTYILSASLPLLGVLASPTPATGLQERADPPPYIYLYAKLRSNETCAVEAPNGNSGYLGYWLVNSAAECQALCDQYTFCYTFNTFHDNNANAKGNSPLLTCALFQYHCWGSTIPNYCTNHGGQIQPDGTTEYITDSDIWCRTN